MVPKHTRESIVLLKKLENLQDIVFNLVFSFFPTFLYHTVVIVSGVCKGTTFRDNISLLFYTNNLPDHFFVNQARIDVSFDV